MKTEGECLLPIWPTKKTSSLHYTQYRQLPVSFLNQFHVFEFINQHRPKQANAEL